MNQLKVFSNKNFGEIRGKEINGQPYMVLSDVCKALELNNVSQVKTRLKEDGVIISEVTDSLGRTQEANFISESNLYRVIFQSRKSEAEKFTEWVTAEVLPTIRKNGAYMTAYTIEKTLTDPDYLIKLATTLKEEMQRRIVAEKQIEEQKPLVLFAETCIASNDSILVRELAKLASKNGIVIGEKKLYKKLREWDLILKTKNEPSQRAMDLHLFEVKKGTYTTPYGSEPFATVKVTPKGQVYIIEKLRKTEN